MEKEKTMYRTGEVAKLRGCSPATILNEIKRGRIHAIQNGNRKMIPAQEYKRLESELKKLEVSQ
jgi:predicted site-specific integrase-resolvase